MKRFSYLFLMLLALVGWSSGAWAAVTGTVITLGSSGVSGSTTDVLDFVPADPMTQAAGADTHNATLADGNSVAVYRSAGRFFTDDIAGSWTNSDALSELNTTLGTQFEASHLSVGSSLKFVSSHAGGALTKVTVSGFGDYKVGDDVVLYAACSAYESNLGNFQVTGLDSPVISYATNGGTGFSTTGQYSEGARNVTLVKVTGTLASGKSVAVSSSTAKNEFLIVAYKVTAGEAPANPWGTITNDTPGEWSNVYGTGTGSDRQRFANLYFTTDGTQTEVTGLPTAADLQAMAGAISLPFVTDGITLTGGKRTTISWTDAGSLQYDYIHAFIDADGDGIFETSLGTVGTANAQNSGNGTGTIAFTVPNPTEEIATRIRIRIDGAWYSNVASLSATANTNRLAYDIPVTLTPGEDEPSIYPVEGKMYTIHGIIDNGNVINYLEVTEGGEFTIKQTTATGDLKSLWVAHAKDEDTFTFTSAADPTKFLSAETGVSTTEYTWDVSAGTGYSRFAMYNSTLNGGRYVASKSNGNAFGKWGDGGHWADAKGQWSTYSTDFIFTENTSYNIYNVVVTGLPSTLVGYAVIDGKNIANGSSVVTSATVAADNLDAVTATAIAGYDYTKTYADGTITITYGLGSDLFNADLSGDVKYVRISNVRAAYSVYANSANALHSHVTDYTDENELFALVGTKDEFRVYSKTQEKYFGYANTNRDTEILANGATQTFKLVLNTSNEQKGYNIVPVGGEGQSFNMHGGNGNDIKFYNIGDPGSTWNITLIDKTAEGGVIYAGTEPQTPLNTKLGKVTSTMGTTNSTLTYNVGDASLGAKTYYLNSAYPFSLSVNTVFRGYTASVSADNMTVTFTADEGNEYQYLWYSTDHGRPYRIPAIAQTRNGDLIALSDDRYCGSDIGYGRVDIVGRISHDNGATWSAEFPVATGNGVDASPICGYGDAAIVADRESDAVMMMCVSAPKNGTCWTAEQRGVISVSPDGGVTWPTPRDIKDEICNTETSLIPGVINYFVGSGKLHQSRYIKVGSHYRVYAALWTTPNGSAINNYVIYTDDFGTTWHLLGEASTPCVNGGNEPKCEEMPDGSVLISSRKGGGRYYNVFTYAQGDDTYSTGSWGTQITGCTSGDSSTNGEILIVQAKKQDDTVVPVAIQSMPNRQRNDVTIWYKELTDDAQLSALSGDWTVAKQISSISSCYSTMCMQADGRIAFFFEEGPAGYEMVYAPLSIDYLTDNIYKEIVVDYSAPLKKVIEAAEEEILKSGHVGYPTKSSASYTALNEKIAAAKAVNVQSAAECNEAKAALEAALTAYYAETEIALPVVGGVYRFRGSNFKNTLAEDDDEWAYLTDTNTSHLNTLDSSANGLRMTTDASEGSNWFCLSADAAANEYKFISINANNLGYQTLTAAPQIVKIQKATGGQLPDGTKPYHNMFGFVNVKVDAQWMCATPSQADGTWTKGDKQNGIGGNPGLGFGVSWAGAWYYPDWQIETVEDANIADYLKPYAGVWLNTIGYPVNDEYTALKASVDGLGNSISDEQVEDLLSKVAAYSATTGTSTNVNTEVVLPTGYYYIANAANRGALYNDYELSAESKDYTLQTANSSTFETTNKGIWHVVNNGDGTISVTNGQGSYLMSRFGGNRVLQTLTFGAYNAGSNPRTAIFFSEALNASGGGQKVTWNGTEYRYLGLWSDGGKGANDNNWVFQPVDGDFWTVTILGGEYVKSADETQYMRNGGFIALNHTPTVADFTKQEGAVDMRVLVNEEEKVVTICYGSTVFDPTDPDHRAKWGEVNRALANMGVGYPRCNILPDGSRDHEAGSAARTNLFEATKLIDLDYYTEKVLNHNDDAVNNSALYLETLEALLDGFYRDTDIELPKDGHVYYFQAHYFDATQGQSLTDDANSVFINDVNETFNVNLVKGFSNNLAMTTAKSTGFLQNGAYWMAHQNADGTFYFTSAIGNEFGGDCINPSKNHQSIYLGKANAYNTAQTNYATFGDVNIRLTNATGNFIGAWAPGELTNGSYQNGATKSGNDDFLGVHRTNAWRIHEVDMNYVYTINVNSDKPSSCPTIQPEVNVTLAGNVAGFDFEEHTSGYGFFVFDDAILSDVSKITMSANDIYSHGEPQFRRLQAGVPALNREHHTIDVPYTFDYASVMPQLCEITENMLAQTGYGYPKYGADIYTDWRPETTVRHDLKAVIDANHPYIAAGDFSDRAVAAEHYNALMTAQTNYYGGMTDADVIIPKNGSPVLLVNEFYNEALNTTYRNYAYDKQNANGSLTLTLAMPSTRTAENGRTANADILPDNVTDPMQFARYVWTIQRDNEQYITEVTETTTERDYTGGDKLTRTQSGAVDITEEQATELTYVRPADADQTSVDGLTTTYVYETLVQGEDGQLNRTVTNGSTSYDNGSDNLALSQSTIHGYYVVTAAYDEIYVRETRTVEKTQKTQAGTVDVLDELGQPTGETEEVQLPVYIYNGEETTERTHTEGEGEDAHDVANEPVYITTDNSVFEKITKHVTEKVSRVEVNRNFPTYYISATVGDGYLGRTSVTSATAILTTQHENQFNVAFVKGTRLGTVGMLFVFASDPQKPRYICGDLGASKFDRYNFQTPYDTEMATQFNGIWSTDWNFVEVATVNTHKEGEQLMVDDKYVSVDSEGNSTLTPDAPADKVITTTNILDWKAPIFEGYPVTFAASATNPISAGNDANDEAHSYASLKLPYAVYLPYDVTTGVWVLTGVHPAYDADGGELATRKALTFKNVIDALTVNFGTESAPDYRVILPRETPVVIEHNAIDKYLFSPAFALESKATPDQIAQLQAAVAQNLLKGTLGRQRVSELCTGTPYVLARKAANAIELSASDENYGAAFNTVAFYKYNGTYIPANKAFLDWDGIVTDAPASVKAAGFWAIDDEEEANIETGKKEVTIEVDIESGEIYDLSGRKLNEAPRHGVYIQNGKKYIAK